MCIPSKKGGVGRYFPCGDMLDAEPETLFCGRLMGDIFGLSKCRERLKDLYGEQCMVLFLVMLF